MELPRENRLLAALPPAACARLRPKLELVELGLKEIIWEENGAISHVYFPLSGVISMIVIMQDASSAEVGTVGNKGMAGLPVFLGAARTNLRAFSQVPGLALRMAADDLQAAACNRVHAAGQRLALWIALCHDRVGLDTFPLTQEFMAQMVGVQRTTVSEEAARLQRTGAIRYTRGVVTVTDRRALEAAAGECLGVIRGECDRLLGPATPPHQ